MNRNSQSAGRVAERGRTSLFGSVFIACVLSLSAVIGLAHGACIDYADYFRSIGGVDIGAAVTALDLGGDLLVLSEGTLLRTYGLADPTAPMERGSVGLGATAEDIKVVGSFAYLALGSGGFRIVDISNPDAPYLRGGINYTGVTYSVSVEGQIAYLASFDGFYTIDVSNPDAPVILYRLRWVPCRDVTTAGNFAFVAGGSAGVSVLDVSNPAAPFVVATLNTGTYARAIALEGTILWIADDASGIVAADVSNPGAPVVLGALPVDDLVEALLPVGNHLFAGAGNGGVYSFDASNPAALALIGKIAARQYAGDLVHLDNHIYFADYLLRIADMTNPYSPLPIAQLDTPGELLDVRIANGMCVLADGEAGLEVADISDPAHPFMVGAVDTPGSCECVRVAGDYAFVADGDAGIQVISLRVPAAPSIVATVPVPEATALDVDVDRSLVYVACGWEGLAIIDVSDPSNPVQRSMWNVPALGLIRGVNVKGNVAALVDRYDSELVLVDVSDPAAPAVLSEVFAPGNPNAVSLRGSYAYVTTSSGQLDVYSIADPSNPTLLNSVATSITDTGIAIDGSFAYVTIGSGGLEVFDLSDPTLPVLTGGVDTPSQALRIAPNSDLLYIADRTDGLVIFPGQCASQAGVTGSQRDLAADRLRVAPNPSAGPTHVRVDLHRAGRLSVALYDVAGRRVRRFDEGWVGPGPHELFWDGRDESGRPVARGVYMIRMDGSKTPARTITVVP